MTTFQIIALIISGLGLLATNIVLIIRANIRTNVKIAELNIRLNGIENQLKIYDRDFKNHELMNERQFENYHKERREDFNNVNKKIDDLTKLIVGSLKTTRQKKSA